MLRFTIGTAWRGVAACIAGIAISGIALAVVGALDAPSLPAVATPAPRAAEPSGISVTPAQAAAPLTSAATIPANPSPGLSVRPAPNSAATPLPPPAATQPAPLLTRAQLAQLLAPVALYPDPLLAQILMAATYPLEVVEAARWVSVNGNRALKSDALTAALQAQTWDPSVKALVPFPRVLQMMSDQLHWTEELGNAFLAQQADVMAAVQSLRQEAMAAGNLKQTPQCRCVIQSSGGSIAILQAEPQVVCAPVYTPAVYGPWPYPAYSPDYFPVPVGFAFAPGFWIGFGPPIELAAFGPFWGWGWIDWGHHDIAVDTARLALVSGGGVWFSGNVWVHDPAHRGGVAYADPATRTRFDAARVAALGAAARGGAAGFARGSEALRGGGRFGAAAFPGGPGSHDGAAFRGSGSHGGGTHFAMGAPHGGGGAHFAMSSHGGMGGGPHGGGGSHFAMGAPHGGGGAHFAMGGHGGMGGGPHSGGGSHFAMGAPHGGGGAHFAMGGHGGVGGGPHGGGGAHFAMGAPHGGGGGGPHGGGEPHGGSGGGHRG